MLGAGQFSNYQSLIAHWQVLTRRPLRAGRIEIGQHWQVKPPRRVHPDNLAFAARVEQWIKVD